jgi:bifunctional ADP-heptose synthase (sugar kinase/adenylyltransferase)
MDIQHHKKSKILLVGDVCIDRYVIGSCDRLSPEAPVPVIRQTKMSEVVGMSGNVFSNISSMNPDIELTWIRPDPVTIIKTRFIDSKSKNHLLRYDIDPPQASMQLNLDLSSGKYDLVVISDYDKGFISRDIAESLTRISTCNVIVDTKKKDLSCFHNCIIKINDQEFRQSKNINDDCEVMVTLGQEGASFRGVNYSTNQVEAHDVCGAGDVFLSAFAVRFIETGDIGRSIMTANSCASHSVTKVGTYTVTNEEYRNLRL